MDQEYQDYKSGEDDPQLTIYIALYKLLRRRQDRQVHILYVDPQKAHLTVNCGQHYNKQISDTALSKQPKIFTTTRSKKLKEETKFPVDSLLRKDWNRGAAFLQRFSVYT